MSPDYSDPPVVVLVAHHLELVRECIIAVVGQRYATWEFTEAGDPTEAIFFAARKPHLIILNVSAPRRMDVELCRNLRSTAPDAQIVILSSSHFPALRLFKKAGCRACIRGGDSPELLAAVLAAVLIWKEGFIAPGVPAAPSTDLSVLSRREIDVLDLLASDRSNKEIAFELGISRRTVECHRRSILSKLKLSSRAALTTMTIRDVQQNGHVRPRAGWPAPQIQPVGAISRRILNCAPTSPASRGSMREPNGRAS